MNIGQSKSNEKNFYANNDWLSQPKDDLWNSGTEENPKKTEYDPCPTNWRVPTYSELMIFYCYSSSITTVDGKNGYWSSSFLIDGAPQVFFPATGYRHSVGSAVGRGSDASYWSSMPGDNVASGKAAFIAIGDPTGFGYANRAFGFPVRCVQE